MRRSVEHVDFLRVDRNQSITVDVPIVLDRRGQGGRQAQGIVEQLLHTLTVSARPGSIPPQLEVDISELVIGGAVRVGDLTLPEGVTTEVDADEQIALGSGTRAEAEPEPVEGEGEEGEEAAAEGGEAADGDDAGE